jgi:hypothetical protein
VRADSIPRLGRPAAAPGPPSKPPEAWGPEREQGPDRAGLGLGRPARARLATGAPTEKEGPAHPQQDRNPGQRTGQESQGWGVQGFRCRGCRGRAEERRPRTACALREEVSSMVKSNSYRCTTEEQ